MIKKNKFTEPEIKVMKIKAEDIIATSGFEENTNTSTTYIDITDDTYIR